MLYGETPVLKFGSEPMPDRKRLGLDSPTDLLAKLRWEIVQLGLPIDEQAVASYRAFNCAVTAWKRAPLRPASLETGEAKAKTFILGGCQI
jgi:hypothetical protein